MRDATPHTQGDFLPGPLRLVESPPSPLPRRVLYWVTAFLALLGAWLMLGRLDIVAVASGKLAPRTSIKIVQPADAGRVAEIAVKEGDPVLAGQVLVRLDPDLHEAETRALRAELALRLLQLRRIDAELDDVSLARHAGDPEEAFTRMDAQYRANRAAFADAQAQEIAAIARLGQDLRAAIAVLTKLARTVPIYQTAAARYATLQAEGFVSELYALERQRERIEKEQDEAAQEHTVQSLRANLQQAERRLAQVRSSYRQQLHAERAQVGSQRTRLEEDLAKALYRAAGIELRAPQAGVIKDLATHTIGTVVSPGTLLLTLVPAGEELQADVVVRNLDVGFVHVGQRAKVKVATYPFQKYGVVEAVVVHVSPDANDTPPPNRPASDEETLPAPAVNGYRARLALAAQTLAFDGRTLPLTSGMQVDAEIRLGERTLLEYVLAPVQKAWHESARER
ncbi:MAG: HlyD family type I secretion periplasmic adaptor subunit [Burkholderiales bacterium]|nr:HlyD family type I secretion periplasmic adaptor subunit [Burkholderiales bacterium]